MRPRAKGLRVADAWTMSVVTADHLNASAVLVDRKAGRLLLKGRSDVPYEPANHSISIDLCRLI